MDKGTDHELDGQVHWSSAGNQWSWLAVPQNPSVSSQETLFTSLPSLQQTPLDLCSAILHSVPRSLAPEPQLLKITNISRSGAAQMHFKMLSLVGEP